MEKTCSHFSSTNDNVPSSVHGHWLLARAAALFPGTELARNVSIVFDQQFTAEKARIAALGKKRDLSQVDAELAYFQQEFGASFERTYGWAWLLKLQEELEASAEVFDQNNLAKLANALAPVILGTS